MERRLIPHHAIKRDIIVAAYQKDFDASLSQMHSLGWTATAIEQKQVEMRRDFDRHIVGVKQLGPDDLDRVIAEMKRTRTDLVELEQAVRARNPIYKIVEPIVS